MAQQPGATLDRAHDGNACGNVGLTLAIRARITEGLRIEPDDEIQPTALNGETAQPVGRERTAQRRQAGNHGGMPAVPPVDHGYLPGQAHTLARTEAHRSAVPSLRDGQSGANDGEAARIIETAGNSHHSTRTRRSACRAWP